MMLKEGEEKLLNDIKSDDDVGCPRGCYILRVVKRSKPSFDHSQGSRMAKFKIMFRGECE